MKKIFYGSSKKSGLPPGTLMHIGERKSEKVDINVLNYNADSVEERPIENIKNFQRLNAEKTISWININGLHDVDIVDRIGAIFNISSMIMEDVLNTNQRPKIEVYKDYVYIVLKCVSFSDISASVITEQISIIFGNNFVITFQEKDQNIFNGIRERLRVGSSRIRKMKADYLVYSLVDAIVDNYFVVMEDFGEKIEFVEEKLTKNPRPDTLGLIYNLKREMLFLHRSIWPLREVLNFIARDETEFIDKDSEVFFRDVYDHIVQIIDTMEIYRDIISGMIDIYLSSVSNRMNEVMKVLTVISTIFMPLTFIAGVYGMNFSYMPELNYKWGYFIIWSVMISIAGVMFMFFRRKKWL